MGTDCHVVVRGGGSSDAEMLVERAVRRVGDLEARWSRFVPTSDTSRLNSANGRAVRVDPSTIELLRLADTARTETLGWFDPFLGRAMVELGYDRTFDDVRDSNVGTDARTPAGRPAIGEPLRSPSPLRLDAAQGTAAIVSDAWFDPGGIGKGHAADVVAAELVDAGADAVLVNLGGDLRVRGGEVGTPWRIDVRNPFDETLEPVLQIGLTDAGLATSSPLKRRWRTADGRAAHHMLDPRNASPAAIELAAVTVAAPTAATAEMLTTAVALAGPVHGAALLSRHRAQAWVVTLDGDVVPV